MTLRLRLPSTALSWDPQLGKARDSFHSGYAGFIVASKQISHLCEFSDKNLPAPPPALARIERLEILLDQMRTPRATTLSWARQEHQYRRWYEALAGSAYQRKICRIVISNIILETFVKPNGEIAHVPAVTELLAAQEKLIGFNFLHLPIFSITSGMHYEGRIERTGAQGGHENRS